jgi:ketosteroid isomerase-like protein
MRSKLGVAVAFTALVGMGLATVLQSGDNGPVASQLNLINTVASSDADQSIHSVLASQQAAWNRGDIPSFLEGYWNSTELTFAGSDGIVRGYDGLLFRYQKSYPDRKAMGELSFSDLEIRSLGQENALVIGHWHLKRQAGDVGGVFSLVFQRFPAGWRIIHDHTSAQKQTP